MNKIYIALTALVCSAAGSCSTNVENNGRPFEGICAPGQGGRGLENFAPKACHTPSTDCLFRATGTKPGDNNFEDLSIINNWFSDYMHFLNSIVPSCNDGTLPSEDIYNHDKMFSKSQRENFIESIFPLVKALECLSMHPEIKAVIKLHEARLKVQPDAQASGEGSTSTPVDVSTWCDARLWTRRNVNAVITQLGSVLDEFKAGRLLDRQLLDGVSQCARAGHNFVRAVLILTRGPAQP
jgi:hypothetical protein